MTAPPQPSAEQAPARIDDRSQPVAEPSTGLASEGVEPPRLAEASQPPSAALPLQSGPDPSGPPERVGTSAGALAHTPLFVALVVALVGVIGAVIGIPLYVIDGDVDDVEDAVVALDDKIDALKYKIDDRFAAQDAKFEERFAAQDAKIEERFAAQDAKIDALAASSAEIDRKLTALIAHLGASEAVDTAVEGGLE